VLNTTPQPAQWLTTLLWSIMPLSRALPSWTGSNNLATGQLMFFLQCRSLAKVEDCRIGIAYSINCLLNFAVPELITAKAETTMALRLSMVQSFHAMHLRGYKHPHHWRKFLKHR